MSFLYTASPQASPDHATTQSEVMSALHDHGAPYHEYTFNVAIRSLCVLRRTVWSLTTESLVILTSHVAFITDAPRCFIFFL